MKIFKSVLIGLILAAVVCCSFGCAYLVKNNVHTFITDVEEFKELFPCFQDVETVYIKYESSTSIAPGPTAVGVEGIAKLSEEEFLRITSNYNLVDVGSDWMPEIGISEIGATEFSWKQNPILEDEILGPGYVGNVYFDAINFIVYIDADFA